MNTKIIISEKKLLRNYIFIGAVLGALFGLIEYFVRLKTNDDPQDFIPLLIRAISAGTLIVGSVLVFELLIRETFKQRLFWYLVISRAIVYTLIISFWLIVINGVWFVIHEEVPFYIKLLEYIQKPMYLINLSSTFIVLVLAVGLGEINRLHRKGELIKFVTGKYHQPREIELIFCFIDLRGSTTIAEQLGNLQFAQFLKDYYSDITQAIRKTNAHISDYVGDEIILSWTFESGLKDNNLINCFFYMKELIKELKPTYLRKYGVYPEFKAGLHGGQVVVTWVGELKKEIVYVGDVLNTTSRIQESCKRLSSEILISGELLDKIDNLGKYKASFEEETELRGKAKAIKLYSLHLAEGVIKLGLVGALEAMVMLEEKK